MKELTLQLTPYLYITPIRQSSVEVIPRPGKISARGPLHTDHRPCVRNMTGSCVRKTTLENLNFQTCGTCTQTPRDRLELRNEARSSAIPKPVGLRGNRIFRLAVFSPSLSNRPRRCKNFAERTRWRARMASYQKVDFTYFEGPHLNFQACGTCTQTRRDRLELHDEARSPASAGDRGFIVKFEPVTPRGSPPD